MQAVKFSILFITIISASCSKNGHLKRVAKQEPFEISRNRTKDSSSIIVGECFDFESKHQEIPAALNINGVVLSTNNGFFEYHVLPGNYIVRVGFIGKKWSSVSVRINKTDSLHIKFYLKDDDTPLYENK